MVSMAATRPGFNRPAGRKQEVLGSNPNGKQDGMAGRRQPYGAAGAFDGWSAHVRYFLARYPLETRTFIAQVRDNALFLVLALLA